MHYTTVQYGGGPVVRSADGDALPGKALGRLPVTAAGQRHDLVLEMYTCICIHIYIYIHIMCVYIYIYIYI